MKKSLVAFVFFWLGCFLSAKAWDNDFLSGRDFSKRNDNTTFLPTEKRIGLQFYSGVSFLKYGAQPGLLELSFNYSRLDTATGGQIPESFYYSKHRLTNNHSFTTPLVGLEINRAHLFFRADVRFPEKRRISQQHFAVGWEWKGIFSDPSHHFSLLAGLNGQAPDWLNSVFFRAELGVNVYKPVWLLDELPVDDTTFFVMGYTVKKSDSNVRSLGVYYEEDVIALTPSFTFGFGTKHNSVNFSLTVSPFLPLSETGGIRLQYKRNNTGWLSPYTWFWYPFKSVLEPGQHGLVEKYDGNVVSKTPYHLGGMEFVLRMGFRIR